MKWGKNKTEYKIGIWSLLVFVAMWTFGLLAGADVYPLGYLMKVAYAGFAVSIFWIMAWFIMEKSKPVLKALIDPDTISENLNQCTPFQKILLGVVFFALLFWGLVYSASLL